MASLLKMSEAASLALHTMTLLASNPGRVLSNKEIASLLRVSEAHLAKVLQRLGKFGLVKSTRGPRGGFLLARSPEVLTLLDVYEAIEGPLSPNPCIFGSAVCDDGSCIFGDLLTSVHDQTREHFAKLTLSELAGSFHVSGAEGVGDRTKSTKAHSPDESVTSLPAVEEEASEPPTGTHGS